MNTRLLLDHHPITADRYVVRAMLRITGDPPPAADRPGLNLAVVLDRSGSMGSLAKLDRAREAASLLVRRVADTDTVSIIAYDDEVRTIAGPTPGSRRNELLARIAAIDPGGMTNLSGGWLRGRELVAGGLLEGGVNRVLLLTDGLANVGITDPGTLRDLVASAAAAGVSTTTIGFGADYDERLLRSLADAGGGSTYYIEKPDQAPAIFEAEIAGLMALTAQNVAVTIAPAPAVQLAAVHHQYPRQQTDDGALRLELGDLYALEPRSLLAEFAVQGPADGTEVDVATFTVEGHVLTAGGGVEKRTATLPVRVSRDAVGVEDSELRRELLILEAARAREEALVDRARGDFQAGARKLRNAAAMLIPAAPGDPEVSDELADLQDMAERFHSENVSMADAKWLYQQAYAKSTGRRASMERLAEDRARERRERRR
jgi:Ca-activated chloride channel homolog